MRLDGAWVGARRLLSPWLLVRGGRVAHLGVDPPHPLPDDAARLTGGWAVEPLADAHVHLFLCGSFDPAERRRVSALSQEAALERALAVLEDCRLRGLAAVRDGGDPSGLALRAARLANNRRDRYAAVLPAGPALCRRGGYGGFLGREVATAAEALRAFEESRRAGATHAKIIATGLNRLDEPGVSGPPQFTRKELEEMAAGAQALGIPLMVHANGRLEDLVLEGPRVTLEHGFGVGKGGAQRLRAAGVSWTPTLGAWAELERHPGLTERQKAVVRATDASHRREVGAGAALGVRFLAGSDAGTPGVEHGTGLHGEIRRLAAAGLGAQGALAAARTACEICEVELGSHLGGLEVAGPAGFLWLDGDPTVELEVLSRPLGVYLGGSWSRLREGLERPA